MRKPRSGFHFSVENNLSAIREYLSPVIDYQVIQCRYESRGIWRKLANGMRALRIRGSLQHVTGDINYLGLFLPKSGTIQTILDCGGLKQNNWIKRKIIEFLWIRIPMARCEVAVTISEEVKKEVEQIVGANRYDIRVIPIALHNEFHHDNRHYQWQRPRIAMVGTTSNKNLERMLQAISGADAQCEVTLCGDRDPKVDQLLQASGITFRHLNGLTIEQMADMYRENDILLYASLYEGFGMPIIEAQACGTAVITSNREPMSSVAGMNGAVLVNPESVSDITAAINALTRISELRKQVIRSGLSNTVRYRPEKVAVEYSSLYMELLSRQAD